MCISTKKLQKDVIPAPPVVTHVSIRSRAISYDKFHVLEYLLEYLLLVYQYSSATSEKKMFRAHHCFFVTTQNDCVVL